MSKRIIIFLGCNYKSDLDRIEQKLPVYLSKNNRVLCFEYPQFRKIFKILFGILPVSEKISENLQVFHSFGLFPFGRRISIINKINHIISYKIFKYLRDKKTKKNTVITFTPEYAYLSGKRNSNSKVIYYIIDNYTSLPFWKSRLAKKQFKQLEKKIIRQSNQIITASRPLFQKYVKKHPSVHCFPTPYDAKDFVNKSGSAPSDIINLKKPVIGFSGSFYDWKINLKLLFRAFHYFNECSFVFLGSFRIDSKKYLKKLKEINNFHYLGNKNISLLQDYIDSFDVCIIPYKTDTFGRYAYPVKINEYLNFGKPVVATLLPALKDIAQKNFIYMAENGSSFINQIKKALKETKNNPLVNRRIKYAFLHSWEKQIDNLTKLI